MKATQRVSFFFGSGAEASYGMPTGGLFALEIFRRSAVSAKAEFERQRDSIDATSTYARNFLPPGYNKKRVMKFGSVELRSIFRHSLKDNNEIVAEALGNFDELAEREGTALGVNRKSVEAAFKKLSGSSFGIHLYDASVEVNSHLGSARELFASKYFSAIIDLTSKDSELVSLTREAIRLYLGALAQKLSIDLNDELIKKSPKGIRVFDEIGGIFNVDIASAGQAAFESVMNGRIEWKKADGDAAFFRALLARVLEEVVSRFFSYQALIDEMYSNLFDPKDWAKFSKISVFLHSVREYIRDKEAEILAAKFSSASGYYHDLARRIARGDLEIAAIGTSNYTSLLSKALEGISAPKIAALNGSLAEYFDPYKIEIVPSIEVLKARRFLVPLMFTQSGTKPMTTVDMSRRYVDYYDACAKSDVIVVVGFGFNGDDGHINAVLRKVIDHDNVRAVIFVYDSSPRFDEAFHRSEVLRKLRVDREDLVSVRPVNNERECRGADWLSSALSGN